MEKIYTSTDVSKIFDAISFGLVSFIENNIDTRQFGQILNNTKTLIEDLKITDIDVVITTILCVCPGNIVLNRLKQNYPEYLRICKHINDETEPDNFDKELFYNIVNNLNIQKSKIKELFGNNVLELVNSFNKFHNTISNFDRNESLNNIWYYMLEHFHNTTTINKVIYLLDFIVNGKDKNNDDYVNSIKPLVAECQHWIEKHGEDKYLSSLIEYSLKYV